MDVARIIELLELAPHPEGGYYRRTFADDCSSAIFYVIDGPMGWSRWHRVLERTEVWHAYAGASVELEIAENEPGGNAATVRLGSGIESGEVPQAVVRAGAWQRSRSTGPWSLVGCTVSPPFAFSAFELFSEESPRPG